MEQISGKVKIVIFGEAAGQIQKSVVKPSILQLVKYIFAYLQDKIYLLFRLGSRYI